ncbi:MAG: winged helix-turn-helix transcriptional regulator [bacterium]|nr:winged helix-turn-helix transcriptional regulator [bacterium]MCP5065716.1 winged helix-turn-helix transcriptional regulator [bacterium]
MPRRSPSKLALSDDSLELVAARFRLLGDSSRLRILRALMEQEHSVQELCDVCGMTQSNVSRHLSLLRREGVVDRTREGKQAFYRIIDPSLRDLCERVCGGLAQQRAGELGALGARGIGE